MGNRTSGSRSASAWRSAGRAVMHLVVREGVAVGTDHVRVHQRRAFAGAGVVHRLHHGVEGGEDVAPVHFLDEEAGETGEQLRHRASRGVDLHRDGDGVAVVLHQEDDRKLEVAGGIHGLPEFALAGGALAGGAEDDLVALDGLVAALDTLDLGVPQPRLRRAHGLEELGAGGARGADDVEVLVAPVRRHLPAAGVGVVGRADGGEELLGRGHAEAEAEGPVAVVEVEPVVGRAEDLGGGGQHALVAGAGDLEKDAVLTLELDLLVVDPAGQQHRLVNVEEVGLFELGGGSGAAGSRGHVGPGSGLRVLVYRRGVR